MNLQDLAELVKTHFQRIVDTLCQHFNDRDIDFYQQVWLCYERLFFEAFTLDFLPLYQVHTYTYILSIYLSINASIFGDAT